MRTMFGSFRLVYICLLVVRGCFAWFGTGYIHPDEHFQNGEVMAGHIFGYHVLRTWEWDPTFPVRSFLPPFVVTGIPFAIIKLFFNKQAIHPSTIFHLERMVFLLLSLLLDYSLYALVPKPASRRRALLLLASSHVLHTFQVRPFSNSLEAVLVALSLVALRRYVECCVTRARNSVSRLSTPACLYILAILSVLGIFTRPTFVVFAWPIALQALRSSVPRDYTATPSSRYVWIRTIILPLLIATVACFVIILVDTWHFHRDFSDLVFAPLNFVSYNMSADNLADHGTHPRWLHLFVNLPMVVGPGVLWFGAMATLELLGDSTTKVQKGKDDISTTDVISRTAVYIVFSSLAILSLQPHQEPRFLTPLVVPFVVLVANSSHGFAFGRLFWATWIAFNIILSILFGILHQGAVVPSLVQLSDQISSINSPASASVVFWKTYMPPRHLLGISEDDIASGKIIVSDLAGASPMAFVPAIQAISCDSSDGFNSSITHTPATMYLLTPPQAKARLPPCVSHCFFLERRVFPHLDLDHLEESLQAGWIDGLSLGVYTADMRCICTATGALD